MRAAVCAQAHLVYLRVPVAEVFIAYSQIIPYQVPEPWLQPCAMGKLKDVCNGATAVSIPSCQHVPLLLHQAAEVGKSERTESDPRLM